MSGHMEEQPASTPFVRLERIEKSWNGAGGVSGLDLEIPRGAFVVLLGPSGCGKSTTLRLLAGLEAPDGGRIWIDGRDVTAAPPAARGLSMVFQSYALFPHLTVAQNITFGLEVRRMPKAERKARLAEALDMTELNGLESRKPAELSGGQRQRVALARAVVAGHSLCLMDEPLSNLDAKLRHTVRQDIRALQRRLGMTVLYVTHDQTEAMGMADVIVLMNQGRIEQVGSPAELYETPRTVFAATFLGSPPMALLPADIVPPTLRAGPLGGRDSLVGVRPEHLRLVPATEGKLCGTVRAVEYLGADSFVYLTLDGDHEVTLRSAGRVTLTPGARCGLGWAPEASHLFDRVSGLRLETGTAPQDRPGESRRTSQAAPLGG